LGIFIIHRIEEKFKRGVKKSSKFLKKGIDKRKRRCYNEYKFKGIELPDTKTAVAAAHLKG